MVWEGKEVVKTGRVMLGATNPRDSAPGTIRGDYAIDVGRNICHGSDAVDAYVSALPSSTLPRFAPFCCATLERTTFFERRR